MACLQGYNGTIFMYGQTGFLIAGIHPGPDEGSTEGGVGGHPGELREAGIEEDDGTGFEPTAPGASTFNPPSVFADLSLQVSTGGETGIAAIGGFAIAAHLA